MKILDVACGGKMMWFDKNHPAVTFGDIRDVDITLTDRQFGVHPDIVLDFRALPFQNDSYDMVVFDPPHLHTAGPKSWIAAKYGKLGPDWRNDLRRGFNECWRVLKPNGVLIFKWNEVQISLREILPLVPTTPLFGHKTKATTHWLVFVKFDATTQGL